MNNEQESIIIIQMELCWLICESQSPKSSHFYSYILIGYGVLNFSLE